MLTNFVSSLFFFNDSRKVRWTRHLDIFISFKWISPKYSVHKYFFNIIIQTSTHGASWVLMCERKTVEWHLTWIPHEQVAVYATVFSWKIMEPVICACLIIYEHLMMPTYFTNVCLCEYASLCFSSHSVAHISFTFVSTSIIILTSSKHLVFGTFEILCNCLALWPLIP